MARPPRRGLTGRRVLAVVLLLAALIVMAAGAWWGIGKLVGEPVARPAGSVTVTIPAGVSTTQIAGLLKEANVVPDAGAFVDKVVADGLGSSFRPGTYTFRQNEQYQRIVNQLNAGPADSAESRLVIPEGYAIWDIEIEVGKVGITRDSYAQALATRTSPKGFLQSGEQAASLEGFLFPATFDVGVPADADALVGEQLGAFQANISSVDMSYAAARNLTPYDVLKIASLIEREAVAPGDRRKVSAIIYNRLKAGMPTGMESSIQYAQGSWKPLVAADLKIDSPYNLWNRRGLPPTPICNPGLASIRAAAHPAKVDYLYMYAIKDDPEGRHYFTNNYDDFMRYQKENPYS